MPASPFPNLNKSRLRPTRPEVELHHPDSVSLASQAPSATMPRFGGSSVGQCEQIGTPQFLGWIGAQCREQQVNQPSSEGGSQPPNIQEIMTCHTPG